MLIIIVFLQKIATVIIMIKETLQVLLTSLFSAIYLFILTKLMGNKQLNQLTLFDYIVGITIGSIAAELATELEKSPVYTTVAITVYALLDYLFSYLSQKSFKARKIINGKPILLMHNGKLFRENIKKAKLDLSQFLSLTRIAGYFDLGEIKTAILEPNGSLSLLPVADKRPLTPSDMNLSPEQQTLMLDVVLDGKIIYENLAQTGNDKKWLDSQLKKQGYKNIKNVYLACCDNQNNLAVYPMT